MSHVCGYFGNDETDLPSFYRTQRKINSWFIFGKCLQCQKPLREHNNNKIYLLFDLLSGNYICKNINGFDTIWQFPKGFFVQQSLCTQSFIANLNSERGPRLVSALNQNRRTVRNIVQFFSHKSPALLFPGLTEKFGLNSHENSNLAPNETSDLQLK